MQLHLYGVFIGIAIVLSTLLAESQARRFAPRLLNHQFWTFVILVVLGGIVGARAWHVATDWQLYAQSPLAALAIWNGGLSILGAVVGGLFTAWVLLKRGLLPASFWLIADLVALSLPVGQAIGRLGNWTNQELYGLPTRLPWAISIGVDRRLVDLQSFPLYHPLFAYEALAVLGIWWWLITHARKHPDQVGSGFLALTYAWAYAGIRFGLDFLRPDLPLVFAGLGWNQIVLLSVFTLISCQFIAQKTMAIRQQLIIALLGWAMICAGFWLESQTLLQSALQNPSSATTQQGQAGNQQDMTNDVGAAGQPELKLQDRQLVLLQLGNQTLKVEVVITPESWEQGLSGRQSIGSDGMLFIFPDKEQREFWMVDMLFAIDMVWLSDGVVTGVTPQVPVPGPDQDETTLPRYASIGSANWVLELPAGAAAQYGVQPGTNGMIMGTAP